ELRLVRAEAKAGGPWDIARDGGHLAGPAVDAIHVGRQLGSRHVPFVVTQDPERRIAEPDPSLRLPGHVVGPVQPLPLVAIGHHRDRPVVLGARRAPRVVLARDEAAVAVVRVAVGVVRRLAEDTHRPGLFLPLHDPVVWNIAPEQKAPVPEPYRPLSPSE